jgi:mono/diheme cytochrome c family protein
MSRRTEFAMRLLPAAALSLTLSVASAAAQDIGDAERGLAYATDHCAECHDIEAGVYGLSVYGAPSFEEIANTRGMSELALVSFFQTSHPSMPNLIVANEDARDIIAYLATLED